VGDENIFIFGLTVEQVTDLKARGYNPWEYYWGNEALRDTIDWIGSDYFTGNAGDFKPLRDSLLEHGDPYLCLADYQLYVDAQAKVDAAYKVPDHWTKMAVLNTARVGFFSSDRTILDYANKVWNLPQVEVP
jgi:glycogen phosphorylase